MMDRGRIIETIRTSLTSSVGVLPSHEWMEACTTKGHDDENSVLRQVLYSDLRDVVRSGTPPSAGPVFFRQLRTSLQRSTLAGHNYQQVLPESFSLMCQLEEVADVSKNAEKRLEAATGGSQQHPNQHPNNNRSSSRCLKLLLSDGYPTTLEDRGTIVGVETVAILNLAIDSLVGAKILLRGPLEARHGLLLLHPGNCTLLGGCVRELVEQRHRALETARKTAGVGVDPTIRALIGTSGLVEDDDENDNEEDEADEASGDVLVAPVRQPAVSRIITPIRTDPVTTVQAVPQHHHHQHPPQSSSSLPLPSTTVVERPTTSTAMTGTTTAAAAALSNPYGNPSQLRGGSIVPPLSGSQSPPPPNRKRNAASITASSSVSTTTVRTTGGVTNPYSKGTTTRNPYSRSQPPQRESSTGQPAVTAASAVSTGMQPAQVTPSVGTTMTTTTTTNRSGLSPNHPRQTAYNPYQRNNNTAQTNNTGRTIAAHATSTNNTGATLASTNRTTATTTTATTTPNASMPPPPPRSNHLSPQRTTTKTPPPRNNHSSSQTTTTTTTSPLVQTMTFENLRKLLVQLVSNRPMYESYASKGLVFRVDLISSGNQFRFDVVKARKTKGSKKEKDKNKLYEFWLSGIFRCGSSSSAAASLACRIHPGLIEPYFEHSAYELRCLNRVDQDLCGRVTDENGEKIRRDYFPKRYWRATLNPIADELFGTDKDAEDRLNDLHSPILLLKTDRE